MSAWDSSIFGAYRHNGDYEKMTELGLRTWGFVPRWSDLGTVEVRPAEEKTYGNPSETKVRPATTVKVEVIAYPARFWRFTITRPRDEVEELGKDADGKGLWRSIYEPVEQFVVETGSGGFTDYWPSVMKIAEHCLEVERIA